MQIQAVVDADVFPTTIETLRSGEAACQVEALYVCGNACRGGTDKVIRYLCELGLIPAVCGFLNSHDSSIIQRSLETLDSVLRVEGEKAAGQIRSCGGLDAITSLQQHAESSVSNPAARLLKDYFAGRKRRSPRS